VRRTLFKQIDNIHTNQYHVTRDGQLLEINSSVVGNLERSTCWNYNLIRVPQRRVTAGGACKSSPRPLLLHTASTVFNMRHAAIGTIMEDIRDTVDLPPLLLRFGAERLSGNPRTRRLEFVRASSTGAHPHFTQSMNSHVTLT
jgi:hypothetical protein